MYKDLNSWNFLRNILDLDQVFIYKKKEEEEGN